MDQRGSFHPLCKRDDVLGAYYVRAQCALERRIEGDVSGAVDYNIEVVSNALRIFFGIAEVCIADITTEDLNFLANKSFKSAAISLAERIEWRSGDHMVPEARLRFFLRSGSYRHIHATDVRKAMQQHAQRNFAKEACAADQKNFAIAVNFSWRKFIHCRLPMPMPIGVFNLRRRL